VARNERQPAPVAADPRWGDCWVEFEQGIE
jgi:hypothetical protein